MYRAREKHLEEAGVRRRWDCNARLSSLQSNLMTLGSHGGVLKREMTSTRSAHLRQDQRAKRAGLRSLGAGDNRERETRWRHIREQIDLFCKLIESG